MKKKPKATSFYMHIMDGTPAAFDGKKLVFQPKSVSRLATSLRQIRREHQQSNAYYTERHGADRSEYSYVRIPRTALSENER